MKASQIFEKQYAIRKGVSIDVVENPTLPRLLNIIAKHGCARGIESNGILFIWDGFEASHEQVANALGVWLFSCPIYLFYETLETMTREADWFYGPVFEGDAFYFLASMGINDEHRTKYRAFTDARHIGSFRNDERGRRVIDS